MSKQYLIDSCKQCPFFVWGGMLEAPEYLTCTDGCFDYTVDDYELLEMFQSIYVNGIIPVNCNLEDV